MAFVIWSLIRTWLHYWALLPLILHSHIRRELRTPHLWICYSANALWIVIISLKSFIHFRRWCLVRELPSPPKLPLSTILNQQSRWEDIHLKWYFLIQVPNQWFLKFDSPRRWACLTPNYRNLCDKFAPLVRAQRKYLGTARILLHLTLMKVQIKTFAYRSNV